MAKQTIDLGTTPNRGDGDPLRTAFRKINENFNELYAGDFAAPDQTASDVVPDVDATYNLGSAERQWADLYVGDFIYLNGARIEVTAGGALLVNGGAPAEVQDVIGSVFADDSTLLVDAVNASIPYSVLSDAPTIPTDISDLTDEGGLLDPVAASSISNGTTRINIPAENGNIEVDGNVELYGGLDIHSAGAPLGRNDIVFFNSGAESGRITTQGETGNAIQIQSKVIFEVKVSQNDGQGGVDSALWEFDANGGLTLPTGVTNNGRIINDNGISLKVNSSFWTFGTDGSLTFPDATSQTTAWTGNVAYNDIPVEYLRLPEPDTLVITPTPNSAGTKGQVIYSSGFVYICVATNSWVRSQVETAWE